MQKSARNNSGEIIFRYFKEFYQERRKEWFLNLYKNPMLIIGLFTFGTFLYFRNVMEKNSSSPIFYKLITSGYLAAFLIATCCFFLVFQFRSLSPRHQFVSPDFSLDTLQKLIKNSAKNIPTSLEEAATSGLLGGALLGTLAMPGLGTLIGAALGGLFSIFKKKSLSKIKEECSRRIISQIEEMFEQLDEVIFKWIENSKESITKAAFESYKRNLNKSMKLLKSDTPKLLKSGRIDD